MEELAPLEAQLRQSVKFLQSCKMIRDLRGHSRTPCYTLQKSSNKYFLKVYTGDRVNELRYIDSIYNLLQIPTASILDIDYLPNLNQTYCIYEFIEGDTLAELLHQVPESHVEAMGIQAGQELRKFAIIKGEPQRFQQAFNAELQELLQLVRGQQLSYNSTHFEPLPKIDLDRLENSLQTLKSAIYASEPVFVHSDINLNNIILHDQKPYFIDTEGGKIKFRALDFRGNCWWGWDGNDTKREQAVYRGIYRGLFNNQIPDSFHQELSFTMMYEFLLRSKRYEHDEEQIHYSFLRWHDNLEQTNYFENYRFNWF